MGVWKRKEASKRDEATELLERLEWFNRPELPTRPRAVSDPPRASVVEEPPALEETPPADRRTDWTLPVPPWETRPDADTPVVLAEEPEPQPEPEPEPELEPEPEPAARWLVAPPRPVAPLRSERERAPVAIAQPSPPTTMRVYRRRLRPALLGALALAISGAFIFAASSLNSQDSNTESQVKSAVPQVSKPQSAAPAPATKRPEKPAKQRAAAPAKAKAKPKPAPKPAVKAKPNAAPASKPSDSPKPKPAAKPTPKPAAKTKPKPAAKPKAAPRTPPPVPTTTTLPPFAWSPVSGAGAYEFQLFRGSKLVYSARTQTPGITVPATWTRQGRFHQVEPGHYRWYVWAIVGGQKSTTAVVQATLDVPK